MRNLFALMASAALVLSLLGSAPAAATGAAAHVFLIVMENAGAQYETQQAPVRALMQEYGTATNYSGVTNPSLPNYLALTSGQIASDNYADQYPVGEVGDYPDNAPWNVPNLFDQLQAAGISWGAYAEGYNLPSGWNYETLEANGYGFAGHHFPALYYADVTSSPTMMSHLQPLTVLAPLLAGAASGVPSFVSITPTPGDATSLAWLTAEVSAITSSAAWQAGGVLIVTWDNSPTSFGTLPGFTQAPDTTSAGGNVLTLVISPNVAAGTDYAEPLSHYSILAAIETAFGLPLLGYAATAPAWPELVAAIEGQKPPTVTSETFSSIGTNPTVTTDGVTATAVGTGQIGLAVWSNGGVSPVGGTGDSFSSVTMTASGTGPWTLNGVAVGTYDPSTGVGTWTLSPTATAALWSVYGL